MKDSEARENIAELTDRFIKAFIKDTSFGSEVLQRLANLERTVKALQEAAKPTCPGCGAKLETFDRNAFIERMKEGGWGELIANSRVKR